jgi:hypothetical protein
MVRRHSWDDPAPQEGEPHQAHQAHAPPPLDEERERQREEAGACLADLLLELHVEGRLTAKSVCCISHWAARAGARGPVRNLAYRPDAASGHFQRHLDGKVALRGNPAEFVVLQIPGHSKQSYDRAVHEVRVLAPHECLHKEVSENPSILEADPAEWPPSFRSHPVIQGAPVGTVVPLAFYMDAAQYTKGGAAVVVFVLCNLVSGLRHLVAVLKKKDFCRCGCKGWCSLRPVFAFLDWSFQALAMGAFPAAGPDGQPWPPSDERRRARVGLALSLRGAVVQIKGDWAEYAHSLGFPTWRHTDYPCLWCRCDRETLYDWDDMVPGELPWMPNSADDYSDACSRAERHVVIRTAALRDRIASLLFYDKRVQGSHGRALRANLPHLGLLAGDRLEPSTGCPDVGAFEQLSLPATVLFWRPSEETIAKHRNPLFNPVTGVTLETLTVDTLHCLYLGVLQVHCSRVIWALIEADAWNVREGGNTTMPARVQESCTRLQHALGIWCRRRAGATNVQDISPYILGSGKEEQKLGLKGGETKSMLLFLHDFLPLHAARVAEATHMMDASRALLRHLDLLKEAPRRFSADQLKDPNIHKGCAPTLWTYVAMLAPLTLAFSACVVVELYLQFCQTQEFYETQVATLRAMRHYCTWTPKFHQWLHSSRCPETKANGQ